MIVSDRMKQFWYASVIVEQKKRQRTDRTHFTITGDDRYIVCMAMMDQSATWWTKSEPSQSVVQQSARIPLDVGCSPACCTIVRAYHLTSLATESNVSKTFIASIILHEMWEYHIKMLEMRNYSANYRYLHSWYAETSNIKLNVLWKQITPNIWHKAAIDHVLYNQYHKHFLKISLFLSNLGTNSLW